MTPERKLEEAGRAERLADLVSYGPDKKKLREQAQQLRREAAKTADKAKPQE